MKLITRDTDYAARALVFIAQKNNRVTSVAELVKELKIPRPFLRKILQALNKNGLLKSYRGQGGGFLLSLPAEKIFMTDLIRTFQGPLRINECFFRKRLCPERSVCALRKKIGNIEKYVIGELNNITVASLV